MDRTSKAERKRASNLKQRYGITVEQYEQLNRKQNGLCAVCGRPQPTNLGPRGPQQLYVDHDHATGRIRGLLCINCNLYLGNICDDIATAHRLADYLRLEHDRPNPAA